MSTEPGEVHLGSRGRCAQGRRKPGNCLLGGCLILGPLSRGLTQGQGGSVEGPRSGHGEPPIDRRLELVQLRRHSPPTYGGCTPDPRYRFTVRQSRPTSRPIGVRVALTRETRPAQSRARNQKPDPVEKDTRASGLRRDIGRSADVVDTAFAYRGRSWAQLLRNTATANSHPPQALAGLTGAPTESGAASTSDARAW